MVTVLQRSTKENGSKKNGACKISPQLLGQVVRKYVGCSGIVDEFVIVVVNRVYLYTFYLLNVMYQYIHKILYLLVSVLDRSLYHHSMTFSVLFSPLPPILLLPKNWKGPCITKIF
jgi:hypothetical protein